MRNNKPLKEIARGVQVGVFWGLTPTIGLQIYIVLLQWLVQNYILKKKFDITLALTLIWISNPITVVPLYFLFYQTGSILLNLLGYSFIEAHFLGSIQNLINVFSTDQMNFLEKTIYLSKFLFNRWGVVLFVGSLVYAVPISFASYFFTKKVLFPLKKIRNRKKKKL
jgi:uncharacterized protein (DUF2062 family)